ncbi:MAG: hypothetical protein H6704_30970 [Myxococcales bacterium]|nr:hypothetical protein [Myxococcales bacterium]MCB9540665.1 hypothetical protein [Myxococcales bacterium]
MSERLGPRCLVLRTANNEPRFVEAATGEPTVLAVTPSTADQAQAEAAERPSASLSVWDCERTTPEQAIALRNSALEQAVFRIRVGDAETVAARYGRQLSVERSPLPLERGPGSSGHCDMWGVGRTSGEPRVAWKGFLLELAGVLVRVE